jgi:hypothetical protein
MELKIQREWLARMAEKEANGIISVGGLVTLAEKTSKEQAVSAVGPGAEDEETVMGTYYNASSQTRKERIDYARIGGGGIKLLYAVCCGDGARLLAFLMATRWQGETVRVSPDTGDGHVWYERAEEGYQDVTDEAVAAFNARFPHSPIVVVLPE